MKEGNQLNEHFHLDTFKMGFVHAICFAVICHDNDVFCIDLSIKYCHIKHLFV